MCPPPPPATPRVSQSLQLTNKPRRNKCGVSRSWQKLKPFNKWEVVSARRVPRKGKHPAVRKPINPICQSQCMPLQHQCQGLDYTLQVRLDSLHTPLYYNASSLKIQSGKRPLRRSEILLLKWVPSIVAPLESFRPAAAGEPVCQLSTARWPQSSGTLS